MGAVALAAENNSLRIEVTEKSTEIALKGWTYFHLIGQEAFFLGADVAACLVSLRDWLREDDLSDWRIMGRIDGIPIVHLILTSERHHLLSAGVDGADRILFWCNWGSDHPIDELAGIWTSLDSETTHSIPMAGIMRLSPEQREKWVASLTTILEQP